MFIAREPIRLMLGVQSKGAQSKFKRKSFSLQILFVSLRFDTSTLCRDFDIISCFDRFCQCCLHVVSTQLKGKQGVVGEGYVLLVS